ncbi:ABC transporter substrate-binding protein [Streptomyces sp. SudanB182_2057]|uniref:ABC transporter substrate-binding protein n=1 Tax=Streptomyces sp. SudanB182_2057 TaxID=3035281 RepID=UPI003F575281
MPAPRPSRLLATLLATPLLAGCFASSGEADDKPADGSRLRVALAFPPAERLSPYGADATILSRLGITESLTALDGNGTAAPALASSWRRQDARTWQFTLREATFHDGSEVTADAVAASLDRAAHARPAPAALSGVTLTAKALDRHRIRVSTGRPDPILPLRLSSPGLAVLSAKAYRDKDRVDPAGAGTGPYVLKKVNGATSATLDRYDGYWGGRAQSAGIDVRFVPDGTARTNALRSGDTDIAEAVPVAQAATLEPDTRRETATTRTTSLLLNHRSGPFEDAGLRAAARAAVDTSALAKDVYEGHADRGTGIYGPAVGWAEGRHPAPVGRAAPKRPDGTRITLATYDNRPELPEVAQVLKQQLEKAGFRVELVVREYARLESDALAGKFDAFVLARNSLVDTGDPVAILAGDYTCAGNYNLALLCDKDVDRAVAEAERTADTVKRQDAALRAEARVLGTDSVVPLVHQRVITGVGRSVKGVLLDPYERTLIGTGTRR